MAKGDLRGREAGGDALAAADDGRCRQGQDKG